MFGNHNRQFGFVEKISHCSVSMVQAVDLALMCIRKNNYKHSDDLEFGSHIYIQCQYMKSYAGWQANCDFY